MIEYINYKIKLHVLKKHIQAHVNDLERGGKGKRTNISVKI